MTSKAKRSLWLPSVIDTIISAEMSSVASSILRQIVFKDNMQNSCGEFNLFAVCMDEKFTLKRFQKSL